MTTIGRVFGPDLRRPPAGGRGVGEGGGCTRSINAVGTTASCLMAAARPLDLLSGWRALGGILLEHGGDEFVHRGRNGGVDRANTRRRGVGMRIRECRKVSLERRTAGEHLEQHTAQGVQVRSTVDTVTSHLLRRDVQSGAPHAQGRGEGLRRQESGDPHVRKLHPAIGREQHVRRFDVPVDDGLSVGEPEGGGQAARDLACSFGRERALRVEQLPSVGPSTSSITMNRSPPSTPVSNTLITFGWWRRARIWASCWNRATERGSP